MRIAVKKPVSSASAPGAYGKPRPAVVIQGDILNQANSRSTIVDAPLLRLTVRPAPGNGLKKISQVQANRILTLPTEKTGHRIGQLTESEITALNRMLAIVVGLG